MNRFKKLGLVVFAIPVMFASLGLVLTNNVNAQGTTPTSSDTNLICRIFPFIEDIEFTRGLCGQADSTEESIGTVASLVRFGLSLIFIGIIIIAIVYIIKSAIKYIRSEGDEGAVQESQKAIKAVFLGIGVLIVGIVGIVIIIAFIGGEEAVQQNPDGSGVDAVDTFLNRLIEGN